MAKCPTHFEEIDGICRRKKLIVDTQKPWWADQYGIADLAISACVLAVMIVTLSF